MPKVREKMGNYGTKKRSKGNENMSKSKYRKNERKRYNEAVAICMSEMFDSHPMWDYKHHIFIKQFRVFLNYFNSIPSFDFIVLIRKMDFNVLTKPLPKNIIR